MAHIDNLIAGIPDEALRAAVQAEYKKVLDTRQFGLVFNSHKPESVLLPRFTVRRGDKVQIMKEETADRTDVDDSGIWIVTRVTADIVHLQSKLNAGDRKEMAKDRVVVIREFGDAIFPGLQSTGKVDRGGPDKPWHAVINGENYHALQALLYPYEGKVDAIYIDPPYNSGARTWKYNNDYVDAVDPYRHSKWLSFMEKRLLLAKRLLNPEASVLIVTIDENEVHRLGMLLDQVFPGHRIQTVTTVINPKGASLGGDFARVDEQIFFVYFGAAAVEQGIRDMLNDDAKREKPPAVKWSSLIRGGAQGIRTDSPGAYYPVFINVEANTIHSFGEALPWEATRESVAVPIGTVAVWPPTHTSGVEGRWGIGPGVADELYKMGALRLGKIVFEEDKFPMSYLSSGIVDKLKSGEIKIVGTKPSGALIVKYADNSLTTAPRTVWRAPSHNAGEYGSKIITQLLPGRRFPFPKALYAVEDTLRFFVGDKPNALVIDFFGGSGTTTHAVARLNHEDGGSRQSILVTNNEMSDAEAKALLVMEVYPGEDEWEAQGVCKYITVPRITAAFTGQTPNGEAVEGDYKFGDEFPMAEGFEENVEFFDLTYEDQALVSLGRKFKAIAPLLWLKAGALGSRIEEVAESGWAVPDDAHYGILFETTEWSDFVDAVNKRHDNGEPLRYAFIVTDSGAEYRQIVTKLDSSLPTTRLYADYLRNFEINTGE